MKNLKLFRKILKQFCECHLRLFDHQAAQIFHDICLENPKAKVEQVQSKPKSKWRPLPMDTVVSRLTTKSCEQ